MDTQTRGVEDDRANFKGILESKITILNSSWVLFLIEPLAAHP